MNVGNSTSINSRMCTEVFVSTRLDQVVVTIVSNFSSLKITSRIFMSSQRNYDTRESIGPLWGEL